MKQAAKLLVLLTLISIPTCFQGQQRVFVIQNSAWGNSGVQQTPPAAFIMSAGVCGPPGLNCDSFGLGTRDLSPLPLYPSSCMQRVTIYSGAAFDAIASVLAQGGKIAYWVPRSFSNDGSIPSDFFQRNQSNGGEAEIKPATVTSIRVTIGPFSMQQNSGGAWEAVNPAGGTPRLVIEAFGNFLPNK